MGFSTIMPGAKISSYRSAISRTGSGRDGLSVASRSLSTAWLALVTLSIAMLASTDRPVPRRVQSVPVEEKDGFAPISTQ